MNLVNGQIFVQMNRNVKLYIQKQFSYYRMTIISPTVIAEIKKQIIKFFIIKYEIYFYQKS